MNNQHNIKINKFNNGKFKKIFIASKFYFIMRKARRAYIKLFSKKIKRLKMKRFFKQFLYRSDQKTKLLFKTNPGHFIVNSGLAFSTNTANWLNKNGYIFINGVSSKLCKQIQCGDTIQLTVSLEYYKYITYNKYIKKKFFKRLNYELWLLFRFNRNFFKQKKKTYPKWTLNSNNFISQINSWIEVDYKILTAIIIYKTNLSINWKNPELKIHSYLNYPNFNWKLIT